MYSITSDKMDFASVRNNGAHTGKAFSAVNIHKNIADMNMGPWISSLLNENLRNAQFCDNDFMGQGGDIVSISELCHTLAYCATVMGYSPTWEKPVPSSSSSSTFDDFERRPGVYKTMLKKVENMSTLSGGGKLASARKATRISVSAKTSEMRAKPSSLGVFADIGDGRAAAEMGVIFHETDHKKIVCKLHRLGKHPQNDPRFYIHMVYRYYMNDLHKTLADRDKVLRYPSIQKVMDVKVPVNCVGSTPPEFRSFLKSSRGDTVFVETLPVPSKTEPNTVVYGYDFESTVPWVPVIRAKIFNMFVGLSNSDQAFLLVYPKYLVKGEWGCAKGNVAVVNALARTIEMNDLARTLHSFRSISPETALMLNRVLSIDRNVAKILPRYTNHPFRTEGEQMRERIGFFLQDSVRGVFRKIASRMPSFCNDIYTGLSICFATMDVFSEFCNTKTSMKFRKREEEVWRNFVIDTHRIASILYAWGRKDEAEEFVQKYGSVDGYLARVMEGLS